MAACMIAGTLMWTGLLAHEHRHRAPFFPIDLLKILAIRQSLLAAICSTFCLLALVFYLPVYYQLGLNSGAAQSGLLLTPVLLGFILGGTSAGRYVGRTGEPKPLPVIGLTLAALTLLALAAAPADKRLVAMLGFVIGLGLGPTMPIVQVVVQTVAGRERLGAATSLVVLSRTLGAALGTAVIGAVVYSLMPDVDLSRWLSHEGGGIAPGNPEVARAFHIAFFVTALVAALGALSASRVPRVRV
jgi:MFS family permease